MKRDNKANIPLVNLERRQICPYNKSHVVPSERFAKHLVKCKLQNPDIAIKICPFDATHHVKEEEFQTHIESCKSKDVVEKTIYVQKQSYINELPVHTVNSTSSVAQEPEIWESGLDEASYNPSLSSLNKKIFRSIPTGLGKSARKQWRETEHARVERVKSGACINDLEYPTPDGKKISIEKLTLQDELVSKSSLPLMSKQSEINKNIMRVDSPKTLSVKPKSRSRIAANIFTFNETPEILSIKSSEEQRSNVQGAGLKHTEISSDTGGSHSSELAKLKSKPGKENVQY